MPRLLFYTVLHSQKLLFTLFMRFVVCSWKDISTFPMACNIWISFPFLETIWWGRLCQAFILYYAVVLPTNVVITIPIKCLSFMGKWIKVEQVLPSDETYSAAFEQMHLTSTIPCAQYFFKSSVFVLVVRTVQYVLQICSTVMTEV